MVFIDAEYRKKLIERLEKRAEEGTLPGVYTLTAEGPRYLTPRQQIEEARKGTSYGEEILFAEKKYMDFLKQKMR